MENEPRSLLCDVDIRCQLNRRYAFLVARYKIHSEKPLDETDFRILEYGSNEDGEIRLAVGAMESSVSTGNAMVLSTERTNNIVLFPTGFENVTFAAFLAIEVGRKFDNAIEMTEVYHKIRYVR